MSRTRALLAAALVLGGAALALAPTSTPPAQAQTGGSSAVTVSGTGAFADLRVTVSQTADLINQIVTVSWSGGAPTRPNTGQFATDFLQIMQCWGDDPTGPERTQCVYGGGVTQSTPAAGAWVRSRQVNYAGLTDPDEPLHPPADDPATPDVDESRNNVFVPFWAYDTPRPDPDTPVYTGRSDFIDAQLTNEIPLARTRENGTGVEFFEVQTARQAPGLGCGETVPDRPAQGRSCWLVVVPRDTTEVDGTDMGSRELVSSPLSTSNWQNRIAIRLDFQPVESACPLGAAERRLLGHELAVEAVSRWQPALCADGGTLFGFSQLSDDVVRNQLLLADDPGLSMLTEPVPPDAELPGRPLVYAPIAVTGLTVAFYIEKQVPPDGAEADKLADGERYTDLKLTPRLVAKLLTQSYRGSVVGKADYLAANPAGLADDPEFTDLNPAYRGFQYWTVVADAIVPLPTSDATTMLWRWVLSDRDARAFLAGKPDERGMVVNPDNVDLPLPGPSYPRNDQSCYEDDPRFFFCTIDAHPFANDMHEAGLGVSRGDGLGRSASGTPNPDGTPKLSRIDRQTPGRRGLIAIVDAATAARYGLPAARLRNAAGEFVGPTNDGMLSAVATMKQSAVPGVLAPNPTTTASPAYPLTEVTYAATSPPLLTPASGKDYATFLRYAVGPGQTPGLAPGELPEGYAPLPNALRTQALNAATTIETQAGRQPNPDAPQPGGGGGDLPPGGGLAPGDSGPVGPGAAPLPGATPPDGAPEENPPGDGQVPVAQTQRTPATPLGAIRYVLAVILVGGGLAAASAPVLARFSSGKRGDAAGG